MEFKDEIQEEDGILGDGDVRMIDDQSPASEDSHDSESEGTDSVMNDSDAQIPSSGSSGSAVVPKSIARLRELLEVVLTPPRSSKKKKRRVQSQEDEKSAQTSSTPKIKKRRVQSQGDENSVQTCSTPKTKKRRVQSQEDEESPTSSKITPRLEAEDDEDEW